LLNSETVAFQLDSSEQGYFPDPSSLQGGSGNETYDTALQVHPTNPCRISSFMPYCVKTWITIHSTYFNTIRSPLSSLLDDFDWSEEEEGLVQQLRLFPMFFSCLPH